MSFDIIFVHGTGVRGNAYNSTFRLIDENLKAYDPEFRTHRCYWGGKYGTSILGGGKSVPEERKQLSSTIADPNDPRFTQGLWGLLYQDPLFELSILTLRDQEKRSPLGSEPPGLILKENLQKWNPSEDLLVTLQKVGITSKDLQTAKEQILNTQDFVRAMETAKQPIGDYVMALSRALLAQVVFLMLENGEESFLSLPADKRDAIVEQIAAELAEQEKGILDGFINKIKGVFVRKVTYEVRRRRLGIFDDVSAGLGDILMYQARGQEIRDYIRDEIIKLRGRVVIIAHSLGGIACVDLFLMEEPPENVELLVTVGSQAPVLYELNALVGKAYDPNGGLPDKFPQWLNIYDRNDFLSYVGAKFFPGRIVDVEVQSNQPFPVSHSAYWNNQNTWNAIIETLRIL
jgi:hypothetical protein